IWNHRVFLGFAIIHTTYNCDYHHKRFQTTRHPGDSAGRLFSLGFGVHVGNRQTKERQKAVQVKRVVQKHKNISVTAAEDIGFIGVDLLLTPNWPSGIGNRTSTPLPDECIVLSKTGSKAISKLAYFLRPRYHFSSGMGCYYERAPYRNHRVLQEKASHVTRFIALADVKNPLNRKLVPIDKMSRQDLTQQPPDVTENPYLGLVDEPDNSQGKETGPGQ
ncbi:hypothetical protein X801_07340, partial [Opisthorchis viverrini]